MNGLLMILFFSVPGMASESLRQEWTVGGNKLHTVISEKTGWMINADCEEKLKGKCKATQSAEKASMKKITAEDRRGGKNPASVLCHTFEGAEVLIALDPKGNQNSFCLFPDHSYISNESLIRAAKANDSR